MAQLQKAPTLTAAIKQLKSVYLKRGFKITHTPADGQFKALRGDVAELGITLNVVSRDDDVPEAERYIRTIKERTGYIYNTLPFNQMPPRPMSCQLVGLFTQPSSLTGASSKSSTQSGTSMLCVNT
jgi:hypothetical protein